MSYLKDIQESNEFLKAFIVSLLIAPFWYLSIFLLNHEFYKSTDTSILIVLSCVLSFISVISLGLIILMDGDLKENKDPLLSSISMSAYILVIWKSLLLFITYSIGFLFNSYTYLYYYIIIYFSIHIVAIVIELSSKKKN